VHLPPFKSFSGWDISEFHDRWDLIEAKLKVWRTAVPKILLLVPVMDRRSIVPARADVAYSSTTYEAHWGTMPETKIGVEHNKLLVVFPSGKSIKNNARLGLSYTWASKLCKRKCPFIGLYDRKTIWYVGKVEAITVARYKDGHVEYADKAEVGRLTDDHQTRIESAFETLDFPLKDGIPRRFYLVDTFCWTDAIKTSPGGMRSHRYFDLSDFDLSKVAYKPHKDSKDYTSEEMAETLRGATWSAKAKA
jgi:hypothetical protein